jgi:hypothetical protein
MISDQGRFFTKMGKCARNHQLIRRFAITDFSVQPIDTALPRAEPALLEEIIKEPDSLFKLTFLRKLDIRRDKRHFKSPI